MPEKTAIQKAKLKPVKIKKKIGKTTSDKITDVIICIVLTFMSLIAIFPLWYTIVASLSNPVLVATGKVILWPKDVTFVGYESLFETKLLWRGYLNTLEYTLVGTFLNLCVTVPCGYALSRKTLPYRNLIFAFFMVPMYFGGGMIATFMVISELGLYNTFWVMVIPHGVTTFNMIICRNYFDSNIPDSLFESATLDGASVTQFFIKFVIPLSKPIIAVLTLYFAIPKWNDYMSGLLYINDSKKQTLQYIIKQLTSTDASSGVVDNLADPEELREAEIKAGIMKYTVIIVGALPLYILYPAVQKYLIGGMMVGAVKE
ncbi:MAG: carbohydrate ABC transporter permease [Oscillospiraceae bacterium]|nr:carbohydrate ABC transporter permease [Oscillospiraceae bacterium]